MQTLFPDLKPGDLGDCDISPCGHYRFTLWRRWDHADRGYVQFIGLNPSTADESSNDQTMHKLIAIAKRQGYSALCMTNIFAWRDTKPKNMKKAEDPCGFENDKWLLNTAAGAHKVVVCWGAHGIFHNRGTAVVRLLKRELWCFGLTQKGEPKHPLFLPATTPLQRYYGV